jgi:pyruvate ferredoxin oxidoreductase gamma subunit
MKEITWYGRGGQGAFTASRILGAAAMIKGYHSIAFPSFGPERRGAPIRAFTKISDDKITDRSIIKENDYIIVLDDTLYDKGLLKRLKKNGRLLINTGKAPGYYGDERVIARDIQTAAKEILKRSIVNIGMLTLLLDIDEEIDRDAVYRAVKEYMPEKVADKNIQLLERLKITGGEIDDKTFA